MEEKSANQLYRHIVKGLYWFRRGFGSWRSHPQWDTTIKVPIKYKRRQQRISVRCLIKGSSRPQVIRCLSHRLHLGGALRFQSFEGVEELMKLLKSAACHQAADGGNVSIMTVMGDASMDGLSDAGSIPARSTNKNRFKSSKIKG